MIAKFSHVSIYRYLLHFLHFNINILFMKIVKILNYTYQIFYLFILHLVLRQLIFNFSEKYTQMMLIM